MNFMLKLGSALALATMLTAPALAQERLVVPGLGELDGVAGAGIPLAAGDVVTVRFDAAGIARLGATAEMEVPV